MIRKALTPRNRLAERESGAAMVEMAIVLPLLLLLVFGIIELGRLYNSQVTLTHAAREGIRDYVIFEDPLQAEDIARQAVSATFDPAPMVITTSACDPGDPTTMTITYPFNLRIPFFGDNIVTIVTEGVMRCGG
jgi:Flp pilus assembly protein TadG